MSSTDTSTCYHHHLVSLSQFDRHIASHVSTLSSFVTTLQDDWLQKMIASTRMRSTENQRIDMLSSCEFDRHIGMLSSCEFDRHIDRLSFTCEFDRHIVALSSCELSWVRQTHSHAIIVWVELSSSDTSTCHHHRVISTKIIVRCRKTRNTPACTAGTHVL